MEKTYSYILALTGASGAIYGLSLLRALIEHSFFVHLIISKPGFTVMKDELDMFADANAEGAKADSAVKEEIINKIKLHFSADRDFSYYAGMFELLDENFLESRIASGSAKDIKGMAVVPCSMGSLSRIACGISGNLIERAADVVLKERKKLIICPRETPLNDIHLKNMLSLYSSGAVILPLIPAFYNKPRTVADIVNFMTGRILDSFGVDNDIYARWGAYGAT